MTRYADPERCPDCRGTIQHGAAACPACDLPLSGPIAAGLFVTLTQADELLRALREAAPAGVPLASATGTATAPVAPARPPITARLSQASVPKILLGLGAACLLIAALVFLAVTWSVMGVAGRTATLVGFTVVTGSLAGWMARRNLRAAAESLTAVALGLLGFDLFGARDSGWFGDVATPDFLVLLGAVLALAGGATAMAVRRTPVGVLTAAEVTAALGVASICVGIVEGAWFATSAALTVAVLVAAVAAVLAHRLRLVVLAAGSAGISGCVWLGLLAGSFQRAVLNPSARELWLELEVWPLVASAVMVGTPALVRALPTPVRVAAVAVAELVLAVVLLIPFAQGSATEFTVAVLVLLVPACALAWFTRAPWALSGAVSVGVGAAWMGLAVMLLAVGALSNVTAAGAELWAGTPGGRLPQSYIGPLEGWLLPVTVAALLGATIVLARVVPAVDRAFGPVTSLTAALAVLTAATAATSALYPGPVWLVTALMLASAVAFTGWALTSRQAGALLAATGFLSGALVAGLYDEWLTAVVLVVVLAAGVVVTIVWDRAEVRVMGGAVVAGALAGTIWTFGAIGAAEQAWTALVALLLLAGLALAPSVPELRRLAPQSMTARPAKHDGSAGMGMGTWMGAVGIEVGAAVSAALLAVAGVAGAPDDRAATWAAVYLTVAGAAVTTLALVRPDRRMLGWAGGLLLAAASWVRLWDVGVSAPEAYTLPSALALGVVGLRHLRDNPSASTMSALAPCLGLALVPSLLWVLWEPSTPRAALLGGACLAMLVGGLRMRWTAPVVFAATVGALVVLRHSAPYIGDAVPRWMAIAATGTLLISMGVTWERRVQEARAFVGYVRALR